MIQTKIKKRIFDRFTNNVSNKDIINSQLNLNNTKILLTEIFRQIRLFEAWLTCYFIANPSADIVADAVVISSDVISPIKNEKRGVEFYFSSI